MMSEARSRRQSRGNPKSYRVNDDYSFLDEDGDAPSAAPAPIGREPLDDEDEDDFMPDADEPEPDDDFDEVDEDVVEDDDENEEDDDEDDEIAENGRSNRVVSSINKTKGRNPSTPNSTRTKKSAKSAKSDLPRVQRIGPTDQVRSNIHLFKGSSMLTRPIPTDKAALHTRGVADFSKIGGQELRLKDLFGPTDKDLRPILMTRDHWDAQETLPYRNKGGLKGGLRRSFFESEEGREKDVQVLRRWYVDSGRDTFVKGQKTKALNTEEMKPYMMNGGPASLDVLMGTIDAPQLHSLSKGTYISTGQSFADQKSRRGWILNLGSRVQEAQWTSNEQDSTQHLAVAVEQKQTNGPQPKPYEQPKAPAFSATDPFPASVQIWSFEANIIGELDPSKQPQLELVICTDWGAPKQYRWCPSGFVKSTDSDEVHLGLLAGIWSDGRVRILDVSYSKNEADPFGTQYLHYTTAAFDVGFHHTVPSCLYWLSSTSLAVATAAGTLAIWTLNRPETFPLDYTKTYMPKPWFFKQIADTYILTLASGRPSRPHYISVTTADGFARLYDLRSPVADTVPSIRGRMLCTTQAWHEQTQSFAMCDELIMLKHNTLRRFYHNLYTIRAESTITCMTTSPVHPGVLVGTADGTVISGNPLPRILNYKEMPWQQNWFVHEWRGPVENLVMDPTRDLENVDGGPVQQPTAPTTTTNAPIISTPNSMLSKPLVRITAGYKVNQPGMQDSITSKKKPVDFEWGRYIAIYEEQSAITTLSWNPNLKFGTWAVAGMGSGLLRVEDIGV